MKSSKAPAKAAPKSRKPKTPKPKTAKPKEARPFRLSDERLKEFVRNFITGDVFVHFQLGNQAEQLMGMVFMPLAFGGMSDWTKEEIADIGCIYARRSDGMVPNRAINGFPMFLTCAFMHKEDWDRARAAIIKAQDALEALDV